MIDNTNCEQQQKSLDETPLDDNTLQSDESTANDYQAKNNELTEKLLILSRQYQSLSHDFENYKRRTEEARAKDKELACEQIIVALLPLVDDFERAIRYSIDNQVPRSLIEGDMAILKRLLEIMAKQGVKIISTDGAFDENKHKAISQIKQEGTEPGMIIEVIQNGYELAGKVIRPASVVVSG